MGRARRHKGPRVHSEGVLSVYLTVLLNCAEKKSISKLALLGWSPLPRRPLFFHRGGYGLSWVSGTARLLSRFENAVCLC